MQLWTFSRSDYELAKNILGVEVRKKTARPERHRHIEKKTFRRQPFFNTKSYKWLIFHMFDYQRVHHVYSSHIRYTLLQANKIHITKYSDVLEVWE